MVLLCSCSGALLYSSVVLPGDALQVSITGLPPRQHCDQNIYPV